MISVWIAWMSVALKLLVRIGAHDSSASLSGSNSINCTDVLLPCKWVDNANRLSCIGVDRLSSDIFECVPNRTKKLDLSGSDFGGRLRNFSLQHLVKLEQLNAMNTRLLQVESQAFYNLAKLRTVILSHNNLTVLPAQLFDPLKSIHSLDVSYNQLNDTSVITNSSGLRSLRIFTATNSNIHHFELGRLCDSPDLTELYLDQNFIQIERSTFECSNDTVHNLPLFLHLKSNAQLDVILHHSVFVSLSHLKYLDLTDCNLKFIEPLAFDGLVNLAYIFIPGNYFMDMPKFTSSTGRILVPKLERFICDGGKLNPTASGLSFEGSNSLRRLYLSSNTMQHISLKGNFSLLSRLRLGDNPVLTIDMETFKGMHKLNELLLTRAGYTFKDDDRNMFSSLTSITTLELNENNFNKVSNDTLTALFQPLCTLRTLGLRKTRISYIAREWFQCMKHLTTLGIHENKIITWEPNTFRGVPLRNLDVSNNRIKLITKEMLHQFSSKLVFVAHDNFFDCTCDLRDFVSFMRDHHAHTVWPRGYLCSTPERYARTLLDDYRPGLADCTLVVPLSAAGASFILLVVCIVLVYRKRLYIRYWFYLLRLHRWQRNAIQEASIEYANDAFVSYSNENLEWVVNMVKRVETPEWNNMKLFVHTRDFLTGRFITDNIVEAIEQSRKTVVVLTKDYARSDWCQFEMNMAHTKQVRNGRDFLLLILLEPIEEKDMTTTLRYLLSNKTYLEWTEEEEGQNLFWRRLRRELERPALAPPKNRSRREREVVVELETNIPNHCDSSRLLMRDESGGHVAELRHPVGLSSEDRKSMKRNSVDLNGSTELLIQ